jgi:iron(III) transport system ATP-binding protein
MAPQPQVLLMDEPFASVDVVLRRALRRECRLLLRERGTTTVLVTHDPDEALDIADRIAVMAAGRIVQFGTPQDLYEAPAAPSVGSIFGGAQVVRAQLRAGAYRSVFGVWPGDCVADGGTGEGPVDLLVQARSLRLEPDAQGLPIRDLHPQGERVRVLLRHHTGAELTAEVPLAAAVLLEAGQRHCVRPDRGSVRAFAATGAR